MILNRNHFRLRDLIFFFSSTKVSLLVAIQKIRDTFWLFSDPQSPHVTLYEKNLFFKTMLALKCELNRKESVF